jgi:photosystem II stability/assembly factor-like uncharacterized protein
MVIVTVTSRFVRRTLVGGALLLTAGLSPSASVVSGQSAPEEWAMQAPLASRSLLLDASMRDGRLVVVGERGHILVSEDSGQSWNQAEVPTRALLTGVFMQDGKTGWAVGHDEVVVRTRDGGLRWERVRSAPEEERPLLDVLFTDKGRGLAVGAYGSLLSSTDGGETWEPQPVVAGDDLHLNGITQASDGGMYLAAEAGRLYRSDDGGDTWRSLASPYQGSFFGLLPMSDGGLLAFGLRGNLFRSEDRGASWKRIETGTEATLTAALELGPDRFVVAGLAGTLLWSEGNGALRLQEMPDRKGIVALARPDDRSLLLVGEGGVQRVEIAP